MDFLASEVGERADIFAVEAKFDPGGLINSLNGLGIANFHCVDIVMDGFFGVLAVLFPDGDSAQLGNGVFDVVERRFEDMELFVPKEFLVSVEVGKINDGGGAGLEYLEPVFFSFGPGVMWIQVEPMLEFIYCHDPWEDFEDIFDLVNPGAQEFLAFGEENVPVVHGEELHGHSGEFGDFRGEPACAEQFEVAG